MTKTEKQALRNDVRTILERNTTIVSEDTNMLRNPKGVPNAGVIVGSEILFTVTGEGVGTPFRRNYLKKSLAKLNADGVTVDVRRTIRGSGQTVIAIVSRKVEAVAPEVAPTEQEAVAA